jgi:hypothetical protein
MKGFKKAMSLFLIVFFSLFFIHCTKYNEPVPFFDGLFLKYHEIFGNSKNTEKIIWIRDIEYRFKELENGNFRIIQKVETQRGKVLDKRIEPVPYPIVGEDLTIDNKGIILKGGDNFNFPNGYPSYLWLPPDKREEGAEIMKVVWKVEKQMKWKSWNVLLVIGMLKDKRFYDTNTGFLMGTENISGKLKMILVDTNMNTLKTILSKNKQPRT